MKIGTKLFVTLNFLFICIQLSNNEIAKEDGVCYFPGSNSNTILEEKNITFPVPINTLINYRCFYNNALMHDNNGVQCLENGNWSGELPTCGNTTSNCKSSDSIEKVIFIDGACIHFSKQIRRNFTGAIEECRKQVNGEIIMVEEKILLTLQKYANANIRYYWIQAPNSMKNYSNGSAHTEALFWQNCSTMQENCCFAMTNDKSHLLINRTCSNTNSWICLSAPIGCGYPDRKPVTLMNLSKGKEEFPLEVKYYCPEGFILEGDETRECRENGSWSGEAPSCVNNSISSKGTNEMTVPSDDSMEEMKHRFNVYIITGFGILAAVSLIIIGIALFWRKKKNENRPTPDIGPREITSFDSETLVSTEELYEEIILDRRDDFRLDDDGYVSTDEVKRSEGEYSSVNSDKIKRTLGLPTLSEERHSHLEDQHSFEMSNLPGASKEDFVQKKKFVMVENDLYIYSDNSDADDSE